MHDITAYILAGGKSSRMGENKSFLRLGGKLLIEHAIDKARSLGCEYFIVGPKELFGSYARTVEDVYPDSGPLGGIHAALTGTQTELNLILAVDTPFVASHYLRELAGAARQNGSMVTVSGSEERLHPLCGIYRKSFAEIAESALKAGRLKLDVTFPANSTYVLSMREAGYDPGMLDNVNTPKDYERARRAVNARKSE